MNKEIKFVFFGSSQFSKYVLEELEAKGFHPALIIDDAKLALDTEKLKEINADVFIVASFGKILPKDLIEMPKFKTLNVHPSLLPKLRGPSPIQGAILNEDETGVTIMRIDEEMDHGPIIAQKKVPITPWPDLYSIVEEKLGREGGKLLAEVLPNWIEGKLIEVEQHHTLATFTKFIKKSDAEIMGDPPERAWRKTLAYEVWPRARQGELIITKAHLENGELIIDRVLPPGRKEINYTDYLNGQKGKH